MSRGRTGSTAVLLAAALCATPLHAQEPGRPGEVLRERLRSLFAARLKADVGLDDAQIRSILPKVEALERERMRLQRERGRTVRELRRGIEGGMPDAMLEERLDALSRLSSELEATTEKGLAAVDRELTVPQRVKLRFLLVRFRADIAKRVQEIRRSGSRPRWGDRGRVEDDASPPPEAP